MRVALACHNFPPEFRGGTERVVHALALALRDAGDEVVVFAGSDLPHDGRDVIEEDGEGVRVLRLRRRPDEGYGLVVRNRRLRDLVVQRVRQEGCDLLHVHHWSTLSGQLARKARSCDVAVIATLHDLWTTCGRFFRRPPPGIVCPEAAGREACVPCAAVSLEVPLPSLARGIRHRDREIQRELRAVQILTAPSRFCADAVARHAPWSGPIEVVPHGLLEPVAAGDRAQAFAEGRPLRVGTFGNLVREKGVLLLVEAAAGLPDVELHLAGPFLEPAFAAEVEDLAARLGVRVLCHGAWRPGEPHPATMLDLAVFPSLCQETYGLVVEEALARGVPVVVSDLGALGERVGAAGLVVPPTLEAMRPALREATSAARLAALRVATQRRFATIADATSRYREFYRRALAATGG
ncbi:MAG: glycosyltransferase [Planctomycetota bacterium]